MRIHIHVQHLLGTGHLVRMKTLAAALAHGEHHVTLISGGMPSGDHSPDYHFLQLPPVATAPGDFTTLLGQDGAPVDADFKARRCRQLLQWVAATPPDVLIVETFPFGRRQLRFELVPLMEMLHQMRPRPLTLCSVRDILQLRSPARDRQTVAEVNAWFDYVLVHADPAVATLGETFPLADQLGDKVFHSGYLHSPSGHANPQANPQTNHPREVIVSAGGGAVGAKLLQTALKASAHDPDHPWRLLVGANAAVAELATLKSKAHALAHNALIVERNRPDFAALLAACAVSVSQAGYNTVLDTVAAACPAVWVPFSQHGETEQTHRAKKFAAQGRGIHLPENALTPKRLAQEVKRAARLDLSRCPPIQTNGTQETIRFIQKH